MTSDIKKFKNILLNILILHTWIEIIVFCKIFHILNMINFLLRHETQLFRSIELFNLLLFCFQVK